MPFLEAPAIAANEETKLLTPALAATAYLSISDTFGGGILISGNRRLLFLRPVANNIFVKNSSAAVVFPVPGFPTNKKFKRDFSSGRAFSAS